MSVFSDNITNELPLLTKIRTSINDVLDHTADLVNNHFGDTKLNVLEIGNYATLLPPDTIRSFVRESNDALKELCRSEFGHHCGLLITKPISLETLEATQLGKPDSWTKYRVRVVVDCFVDESTVSDTGAYTLYSNVEMTYEKIIYNEPHWP